MCFENVPLFDKPFNHVFELDAIVCVVAMNFMETTTFGYVSSGGTSNKIRVYYHDLLEFTASAFHPNHFAQGV